MQYGVLGLGAVAWTDGWTGNGPEPGQRLSIDPARLLELLRGLPASQALLTDLKRAVTTGRTVAVFVSADRQVAEIATGSSRYVLTVPARDSVLAALVGRPEGRTDTLTAARAPAGPQASVDLSSTRNAPAEPGVLWQSPSVSGHPADSPVTVAFSWLGTPVQLEINPDAGGRQDAQAGEEAQVCSASLRLQLPHLGALSATIRLCGSTVAVSIECDDRARVQDELNALAQALSARGLVSAHVGAVSSALAP